MFTNGQGQDSGPMMIFNPGQGGWQHEGPGNMPMMEQGADDQQQHAQGAEPSAQEAPSSGADMTTNAPAADTSTAAVSE